MLFGEKTILRPFRKEDLQRAYEFENDIENYKLRFSAAKKLIAAYTAELTAI